MRIKKGEGILKSPRLFLSVVSKVFRIFTGGTPTDFLKIFCKVRKTAKSGKSRGLLNLHGLVGEKVDVYKRQSLYSAPPVALSGLDPSHTALVIVDMINGFVNEGPLSSENAKKISPAISKLLRVCVTRGRCV